MLMDSSSLKVQCQAALALRNLASDGEHVLLTLNALEHVTEKYQLEIVKADRIDAIAIQAVSIAKYLPGQILKLLSV